MSNFYHGDEVVITAIIDYVGVNYCRLKIGDIINGKFVEVCLPKTEIAELHKVNPENAVNLKYDNYSTIKDITIKASCFIGRVLERSTGATWLQNLSSGEVKIVKSETPKAKEVLNG